MMKTPPATMLYVQQTYHKGKFKSSHVSRGNEESADQVGPEVRSERIQEAGNTQRCYGDEEGLVSANPEIHKTDNIRYI